MFQYDAAGRHAAFQLFRRMPVGHPALPGSASVARICVDALPSVTGDTLGAGSAGFIARSGRPILEKPFVPAELRRLMADLVPDTGND